MTKIKINCNSNQHKQYKSQNLTSDLFPFKIILLLSMCLLLYFSFVCISAYANVYFKTTITKHENNTNCGSVFEPGAPGLPYYCTSICARSSCTRCGFKTKKKKTWFSSAYTPVSEQLPAKLTQALFDVTIHNPLPTWFVHDRHKTMEEWLLSPGFMCDLSVVLKLYLS